MAEKKAAAYRTIFIIFIVLAILTAAEYFASTIPANPSAVLLFIIAFGKAALVVNFFMHINRIWREDEH